MARKLYRVFLSQDLWHSWRGRRNFCEPGAEDSCCSFARKGALPRFPENEKTRKPPFVKVQGVTTLRRLNRRAILAVCFVMHCGDKDQGCEPLAWYYPLKCLVPPPGGESALVEVAVTAGTCP